MLPHVLYQQGLEALRDGRVGVGGLDDRELARGVLHEPGPAAAELGIGTGRELRLEGVEAPEVAVDELGHLALRDAAAVGREIREEEVVVVDLRGVVEERLVLAWCVCMYA